MVRRFDLLFVLLLAISASTAMIIQLPQTWLGDGLLLGSEMSRTAAEPQLRPYRIEAPADTDRTAEFRQVRVIVQHEASLPGASLALIGVAPNTRIFLNNIRVRPSGRASHQISGAMVRRLPDEFWHDGSNTLDIITPTPPRRDGHALALLAGSEIAPGNVQTYLVIKSGMRMAAVILGLCVAGMFFVSLAVSPRERQRRWWAANLALALTGSVAATMPLAALSIPTNVISFAGMACAISAAAIAAEHARYEWKLNRTRLWSLSLYASAAIAAVFLLAGYAGARWAPIFAVWPTSASAIGIGMALTVLATFAINLIFAAGRSAIAGIRRSLRHETLIREQENTISRQSADLDAQIHRRAVLEERERFSRDIHDGLGGSLLTLLIDVRSGSLEKDELEAALEANLDELRMMVDSLDHSERSLNAALSTYRTRVGQLFENAGITLTWSQPDAALPERSTPDFILHLYRILQEAASNVVRHSRATNVRYRFDWEETTQQLRVAISDNGPLATPTDRKKTGNGLKNMARRVEEMRGKFEAGPEADGGWTIRFSVPV